MRRRQALALSVPFVLNNPYRYGQPAPVSVAALEVGDAYFCVEYQLGVSQVVSFVVKKELIGSAYVLVNEDPAPHIARLKQLAMERGATLEAIQLLGQLTPLSRPEEAEMAKLSRKDELKQAANETPVKGKADKAAKGKGTEAPKAAETKEAPKKKGNAEALAKARAERGPPPNRKYKVLTKENPGREGSWTAAMVDFILKNKDTDSATAALKADGTHEGKRLDFKWAEAKGLISFS